MVLIKEEVCEVYNASMTRPLFHLECLGFEHFESDNYSYYSAVTNNTGNGTYPGQISAYALINQKARTISVYFLAFYMIAMLFYLPHLKIFRFEPQKVLGSWILLLHFSLAPLALLIPPIFVEFSKVIQMFGVTELIHPVVRWVIGIQVVTSFIMMCMVLVIHMPSTCKAKIEGKENPIALLLPVLPQTVIFSSNLFYAAVFELAIRTSANTYTNNIFAVTIGALSYSNVAAHLFAELMPCCILRHCRACSKAAQVCPHISIIYIHIHTCTIRIKHTFTCSPHPQNIAIKVYPELKELLPKRKGCRGNFCHAFRVKFPKERVITFTDGVLCIAATLVFIDLEPPDK